MDQSGNYKLYFDPWDNHGVGPLEAHFGIWGKKGDGNCGGGLTKRDSCANQADIFCYRMTKFEDIEKAGAII